MKASVRNLLTSLGPASISIDANSNALKDRILKSSVRLQSEDEDDGIFNGHSNGNGNHAANGASRHDGNGGGTARGSNHVKNNFLSQIDLLEVHPTEPILCYIDIDNSTRNNKNTSGHKNSSANQRIVFQNYITNRTIHQLSLYSLVQKLIESQNNGKTQDEKGNIHTMTLQACRNLGRITSIQFMDRQVLYYSMGRSASTNNNADIHHADFMDVDSPMASYLILHFAQTILLYNHKHQHVTTTSRSIHVNSSNTAESQRPGGPQQIQQPQSQSQPIVIDITQSKINNSTPTSKPIPIISTQLLAIGCSDGAMRFFHIRDRKVVKSVRGPNGRHDPVIAIVAINPWKAGSTISIAGNKDAIQNKEGQEEGNIVRIATVCSSGTAYIWELLFSVGSTLSKESPGRSTSAFKVRSPLVKLDFFQHMRPILSSSAHSNMRFDRLFKVKYDPDRELLFWTIQGGGNNGSNHITGSNNSLNSGSGAGTVYIGVWECNEEALLKSSSSRGKQTKRPDSTIVTPLHRPSRIISISSAALEGNGSSSSGSSSSASSSNTNLRLNNIVAGIVHPSFPDAGVMNLVVSEQGDVYVIGGSRYQEDASSSAGSSGSKTQATASILSPRPTSTPTSKIVGTVLEQGVAYHKFPMKALQKSQKKLSHYIQLLHDQNKKVQVLSVCASQSRPDLILMATNMGVMVVNLLDDEEALRSGSHHVMFPVGRGSMNGLISVEDSSVYVSLLAMDEGRNNASSVNKNISTFSNPNSSLANNPTGKMAEKDKILVYESPPLPSIYKSRGFQSRPVRAPPRLLSSPSGTFLCLFWHEENRYEILHTASLTDAMKRSARDLRTTPGFSPAVDSGFDVLSFAWVGDEDVFALLCPPELIREKNSRVVKRSTLSGAELLGTPSSVLKAQQVDLMDENAVYDPAKFKPRVELKILVGVNADAAEFTGSIAAATATFLGSITLRGRHAPTCLFGGPVLCVGSFSQDHDTSQRDGIAYFYCLRPDAVDDKASSYVSVGPALPYPDLLVWNDDGTLCAMVVGRRIAIYRTEGRQFILMGTAYLGTNYDFDPKVQSLKFLHGVLYCSTEKSVQCIFLGDLYNDGISCETDSFALASIGAPMLPPTPPHSIIPTTSQMSLFWPSILGYHQGSLLVSSTTGVYAVPLAQPLLRIGSLLAAGQISKAQRWIDSLHLSQHKYLSKFLSRRGFAEMAINLPGLSPTSIIQLCLKYGLETDLLNEVSQNRTSGLNDLGKRDNLLSSR